MTNLLTVLPDFNVSPYSHILPSLEKALVSTADLLTLDALDVAKRAQVPPGEVKKLTEALLNALHASRSQANPDDERPGSRDGQDLVNTWATISTLDDSLDAALDGGIGVGHLTEIVGESAAGKTQFLLTLLLSAQLSESTGGQQRSALYISTEAPLQTTRLTQILKTHPKLSALPESELPSLSRIHSTHIHDVQAQDHILRFQAPVAIEKHNIGLLIVDSIAANFRAEFDRGGKVKKNTEALAKRSFELVQLGTLLRSLARTYNIAVVVANQVADRFSVVETGFPIPSQSTQGMWTGSPAQLVNPPTILPQQPPAPSMLSTDDPLALDHQQRFFTGWGDDLSITDMKTPSLGLTWTNQLAARVALLRDPIYEDKNIGPGFVRNLTGWKRTCKVVFSAWCAPSLTEYEIWEGGIRSVLNPPITDERK